MYFVYFNLHSGNILIFQNNDIPQPNLEVLACFRRPADCSNVC